MIEELEDEVAEMRAIVVRSGAAQLKSIEEENKKLLADLKTLKTQNEDLQRNNCNSSLVSQFSKLKNLSFQHRREIPTHRS